MLFEHAQKREIITRVFNVCESRGQHTLMAAQIARHPLYQEQKGILSGIFDSLLLPELRIVSHLEQMIFDGYLRDQYEMINDGNNAYRIRVYSRTGKRLPSANRGQNEKWSLEHRLARI